MAFVMGRLRLSPEVFWAMTPRELAAAMRGAGVTASDTADAGGALERADFLQLAEAFPD